MIRKRRLLRRALALLSGSVLALCAAEGCLRVLLFSDAPLLAELARPLRRPALYADMRRDDAYWKLLRIWTPPADLKPFTRLSPRTGWTGARIDPVTLRLKDELAIRGRRPVLLYGDSFAECVTPREHAWQGLMDSSPEGRTHALLNFGVSGFGTDQSLSMLEATIERFVDRRPLVVFSIFLDEDPDRALLSFRGMPKPRYALEHGELVFHPLEESDAQAWWEHHPPGIPSYTWRLLRGALPASAGPEPGTSRDDRRVIELNRALLARMHRRLEELHVEHVVLAFHGRMMFENPLGTLWREKFVRAACSELGVPFLSSRPYLLAAVAGKRDTLGTGLFVNHGPGTGHLNERGNCAVFEAFRQIVAGRVEREDFSGVPDALLERGLSAGNPRTQDLALLGRPARLRFHGESWTQNLREVRGQRPEAPQALGLFPALELPTQLEWKLERSVRFAARLRATSAGASDGSPERVRVSLLADDRILRSLELAPGAAPLELEQEVQGACTFALRVEAPEGRTLPAWLLLEEPAFR